jgi:hypothetical protein
MRARDTVRVRVAVSSGLSAAAFLAHNVCSDERVQPNAGMIAKGRFRC